MKKISRGLILSVAFLLLVVYLFIPGTIKTQESVSIDAALPAVSRVLAKDDNWKKWWPSATPFKFDNKQFKPQARTFNTIGIGIYADNDSIQSRMELAPIKEDSMVIIWKTETKTSINPFKRFAAYINARGIQKNMTTILGHLMTFLEDPVNIYGIPIRKTRVVDSLLISTRWSFDHKPGIMEIDAMIQSLKKYIAANNATEMNYPMLNITTADSSYYEVMTAIPVDKALPDTKDFAAKRMLKGGNILEGEVKGGPSTIDKAIIEFENYRSDHQYTSPAIPYQLLITDRAKETDTTKWVTKLYYPIL